MRAIRTGGRRRMWRKGKGERTMSLWQVGGFVLSCCGGGDGGCPEEIIDSIKKEDFT